MGEMRPCLLFKTEAEEAATFYASVFPNSRIINVERHGEGGPAPAGSVMAVDFELDGTRFVAVNGPDVEFTPAVSFQVFCDTQEEVDRYWEALTEGGEESRCGWLEDRYGLSWQIIPRRLTELLSSPDPETAQRAMKAMLGMRKIVIAELERAAADG